MSYKASARLSPDRPVDTHTVLESHLYIVLLVGEEGADPRPGPAEDRDDERDLDLVAWVDEVTVVDGPEGLVELDQLFPAEEMFGLLLLHDQAFLGQGVSHPLVFVRSAGRANHGRGLTHTVHRLSVFLFDAIAGHSSEAGEEPFRERVQGVGRDESRLFVDVPVADRGDEAEEVFDCREVERGQPFTEALRSCGIGGVHFVLRAGTARRKAPRLRFELVLQRGSPIYSQDQRREREAGRVCYVHSPLVALQSTVLVFEGLGSVSLGVPLAVLSPVRSWFVSFGGSFVP